MTYMATLGQVDQMTEAPDADDANVAARWIQEHIDHFRSLSSKILADMRRASQQVARYRDGVDEEREHQARTVLASLQELFLDYGTVRDRLDGLVAKIPGLGIVPLIPILATAAVLSVAFAMWRIFAKETAQEKMLELISQGALSAAEAERLNIDAERTPSIASFASSLTSGLQGASLLAVLGAGFLVFQQLPKRRRRTTR